MKDKPKPKLNTKNPTPLQLLARQQNWEKLKLKGAMSTIKIASKKIEKDEYTRGLSAHLSLSYMILTKALDYLESFHKQQRNELFNKIKNHPIPHSGEE